MVLMIRFRLNISGRLPRWCTGRNLPANAGDAGLIPGLGRSPGVETSNPLQYFCLESAMERGAWWAPVHGVTDPKESGDHTHTQSLVLALTDKLYLCWFLEKEMATHSSVLAWRIPGTGEPGGLPSMGSHRVRHDWSDLAAAACWFLGFPGGSSG